MFLIGGCGASIATVHPRVERAPDHDASRRVLGQGFSAYRQASAAALPCSRPGPSRAGLLRRSMRRRAARDHRKSSSLGHLLASTKMLDAPGLMATMIVSLVIGIMGRAVFADRKASRHRGASTRIDSTRPAQWGRNASGSQGRGRGPAGGTRRCRPRVRLRTDRRWPPANHTSRSGPAARSRPRRRPGAPDIRSGPSTARMSVATVSPDAARKPVPAFDTRWVDPGRPLSSWRSSQEAEGCVCEGQGSPRTGTPPWRRADIESTRSRPRREPQDRQNTDGGCHAIRRAWPRSG